MSRDSVNGNISNHNPDKARLLELAGGMPLLLDPGFVPNGIDLKLLPPLSKTYKKLSRVVNKMLIEDYVRKGLAFIVPISFLAEQAVGSCQIHVSRLSWTPKQGKEKGRPIMDCSGGEGPINSEYTKEQSDLKWGVIEHPSIYDIVEMILEYASVPYQSRFGVTSVPDTLVLWKMDLAGAYTLLSFRDEDVPYVAARMDEKFVIFFLCGVFGWCGTPAAFQVVTRALVYEINQYIKGSVMMYVDDIIGISYSQHVESDMSMAKLICNSLFNNEVIEDSKTVVARSVDVIGYHINLDTLMVSVSHRNYLKVVYGLSSIDFSMKVPIKTLQRFASWASRYGSICHFIKPLIKMLYNSFTGYTDQYVSISLSEDVQVVVRLLRAIFIMSMLSPNQFTLNIRTLYGTPKDTWIIEFDASH